MFTIIECGYKVEDNNRLNPNVQVLWHSTSGSTTPVTGYRSGCYKLKENNYHAIDLNGILVGNGDVKSSFNISVGSGCPGKLSEVTR